MEEDLKTQSIKYLSEIRLFRFYDAGKANHLEAYLVNLNASEKILSMVSIFEVILRNKIHLTLSNNISHDYLTNKSLNIFKPKEYELIEKASNKSKKAKVSNKQSKIITLLTLGFWCNLLENNALWCRCLCKIFPREIRRQNKIKIIIEKAKLIVKIRNKIAHHERIINKKGICIEEVLNSIKDLTLWLIEKEDSYFFAYISDFLDKKITEIKELLL